MRQCSPIGGFGTGKAASIRPRAETVAAPGDTIFYMLYVNDVNI
jgi:hypothetical protein